MNRERFLTGLMLVAAAMLLGSLPTAAEVNVQCPGDTNGDAVIDNPDPNHPNAVCMHLTAGDGYIKMPDGTPLYTFGFANATGVPQSNVMVDGILKAAFPAPTIAVDEGDELYLNLTNVGMLVRPDLFDPHTVHFHGFPQAASVFDGLPESAIAVNMGATLAYYYNIVEPGTYMYHCHVEATEHMQMGMLGNLYVRPAQNGTPYTYRGRTYTTFAYNDGDGSTGYDREVPIQIGSFDTSFHNASEAVQPLPFALMRDDFPMLNGRGYPDTVNPNPLTPPAENGSKPSQLVSSLITATPGQRVLLRISNLNVTRYYTLATLGLPMQVIARDAKLLRGPSPDGGTTPGKDLYYTTNSVTVGGGESVDVILDTAGTTAGDVYFLYAGNLNYLNNKDEEFGGMMTEIRIN